MCDSLEGVLKSGIRCPCCGGSKIKNRGAIPSTNRFAGNITSNQIDSNLFRCIKCNLQFRYPTVSIGKMNELYGKAKDDIWTNEVAVRNDFNIAQKWIRESKDNATILDIGCYRGDFLASLRGSFNIFGIELNELAAEKAVKNGVTILGSSYEAVDLCSIKFDIITAIDFVEHIINPLDLLKKMKNALKPGGILIISTGNTNSNSWRFMGSRYWYCSYAEHVAFINKEWCIWAANELAIKFDRALYFPHENASLWKKICQCLKTFVYYCSPKLFIFMKRLSRPQAKISENITNGPPNWSSARDHIIVQFSLPVEKPN